MKPELKIVRANRPCTCPKCAPKKQDLNAMARLKSLATLLTAAAAPAPKVETGQRVYDYVMSFPPPPPDLNELIRQDRAKEKK